MAIQYIDDGRSDGSVLGNTSASTTPKVAFFGAAPVVQPAGYGQTAITRGNAAGTVLTFAVTNSPASVATVTTAELGMTLVGGTGAPVTIASGDLLYINKPTSQAGLGVGNVRVSSAGVAGVEFVNLSGGFLTPTASEVYGVVALRGLGNISAVLTPASVAANKAAEQQFTVTGLRAGDLVQVNKPTSQAGLAVAGARVVANNTLGLTFLNSTTGALTPTAGETYTVISLGGLDAANNLVQYQVSGATLAGVGASATSQLNVTVGNLAVSDTVLGVSKPTVQSGLILGASRVSSAGFVGLVFANVTSSGTLTPTANEVYSVLVRRPNPVAPLLLYSQTLTPTSVAANTTAEQTFTVTGLVASSPVWVNPPAPSNPPSVPGITGVRISAASTLAINFANPTAGALTPTSGTYLIGNFQMPIDTTGETIIQDAVVALQQNSVLSNATRTALVNLGLMAGS